MALGKPLLYAVLHVGSSSMSITIAEYKNIDQVKIIEYAGRDVSFGEEVFQNKRLSFDTIEEMCRVLKGYRLLMEEYGVTEYRLYGTSVVREAENRLSIIDQIFIQTGMRIEVVDMPKEVYYKYFALYYDLSQQGLTNMEDAVLFLDMTSGGVGITVWKGGAMLFQQNVHLGSLRVMESFTRNQRSSLSFPNAISEYLYSMISPIKEQLQSFDIKYLMLSGDEAVLVAKLMGFDPKKGEGVSILPAQFKTFLDNFNGLTATKLVTHYNLPEHRANIIMPTILLYAEIIKMTMVKSLIIGQASFSEGVTLYYGAEMENHPYLYMLREQNVQLARTVAARYHSDDVHLREVERFGVQICECLRENGISDRIAYLYRIAAILCDVGKFVNLRNHSVQAYHIIMNTDIFGLSESEKEIVANVVYYHYKGQPGDKDSNYAKLREWQKIVVAKLSAVIRLAIALDASHNQKIKKIEVDAEENALIVKAHTNQDISLEKWTFEEREPYFREIFGLDIKLVERG